MNYAHYILQSMLFIKFREEKYYQEDSLCEAKMKYTN